MRAPALVLALALAALAGCAGCARSAATAGPGIAGRTAIAPEERSTCETLGRVDLAVVATDPAALARSAAALDQAGARAPGDIGPALVDLARAYERSATEVRRDPRRSVVVAWFNSRCGGVR